MSKPTNQRFHADPWDTRPVYIGSITDCLSETFDFYLHGEKVWFVWSKGKKDHLISYVFALADEARHHTAWESAAALIRAHQKANP